MDIKKFFKNEYVVANNIEVVNHTFQNGYNVFVLWATRQTGMEHWSTMLEVHELKNEETDSWHAELKSLGWFSDDALITFVKDFDAAKYLKHKCDTDCAYCAIEK